MGKKFERLLKEFRKLKLPDGKYAIYGSGPLAVRAIREGRDLDVIVTDDLYRELKERYSKVLGKKRVKILEEKIKIGEIEIWPCWAWGPDFRLEKAIKRAEMIQGLRFVRLDDLLKRKKKMGREKDFKDIKMIGNYLRKTE